MKVGIDTKLWALAGISLKESLDGIAALGIKYVDILGRMHGDPRSLTQEEQKEVRGKLNSLGLVPSNFCAVVPGNIASSKKKEVNMCLDYMFKCIDFAAFLGYTQMLTLCGIVEKGIDRESSWANSVRFLSRCASYAQKKKICLTIESMESKKIGLNLVNTVQEMAKIVHDVASDYLRVNLDLGHLNVCHMKPKDIEKLENLIVHVHISDNNGLVDGNDLTGTGTTPIREYLESALDYGFLNAARKYGGEAVASIEVGNIGQKVGNISKHLKNPSQIARKCIEYLLKEVPFLRLK